MLEDVWLVRRRDVSALGTEDRARQVLAQLGEADPSQLQALLDAHRGGRTEVQVVDGLGAPAKGAFWQATIAGRTSSGVTDASGAYVLHHPRAVESCDVELTKLDGSAWHPREGPG